MVSFLILLMIFFQTYLILYACKYLPACLSIAMWMPSTQRGQKMMLDPLEIEWQIAM